MKSHPFSNLPYQPNTHFRLYYYAAVLRLVSFASASLESIDALIERFPFLKAYMNELVDYGLEGLTLEKAPAWWQDAMMQWEQQSDIKLPLLQLREALGLDHEAILLLITAGLCDEESRFSELFQLLDTEHVQSRPTSTLLKTLSQMNDDVDIRPVIRQLVNIGLLQVLNQDDPYPTWVITVNDVLWEAIRGDCSEQPTPWLRYTPVNKHLSLSELILPAASRSMVEKLPPLLVSGELGGIAIRGPKNNGRFSVLSAIAAAAGYGTLEICGLGNEQDERWKSVGPLATLLRAMPVIKAELAPGEILQVPLLTGYQGCIGFVIGKQGGVQITSNNQLFNLVLTTPEIIERQKHWSTIPYVDTALLHQLSTTFRMSSGNIRRAAKLAQTYASMDERSMITLDDARRASRVLNQEALETLATYEPGRGDWSHVVCGDETYQELQILETRCRQREQLMKMVGPAMSENLNTGVRALLKGPSGTGKTLAAKVLSSVLNMDLYRVDLSSVVNKFIGETEKNLERIFARAEELDVMLLFDEGDALMGRRTNVNSANDRYANLETNFLLQRLEAYEGIVIITTNAAENIDSAFQRRMDVVVDFCTPEFAERLAIWKLHLPAEHLVEEKMLQEIAMRCELSGGQIRNAVLHAALLCSHDRRVIDSEALEKSVYREYRKRGAVCPLRRSVTRSVLSEV